MSENVEKIHALHRELRDLGLFFDFYGDPKEAINLKPGEWDSKVNRQEEIKKELEKLINPSEN